jgi:hypothetical protein
MRRQPDGMSTSPMPTRTRLATFVVALAATAVGTVTPAASDARPGDLPAGEQAAPLGVASR